MGGGDMRRQWPDKDCHSPGGMGGEDCREPSPIGKLTPWIKWHGVCYVGVDLEPSTPLPPSMRAELVAWLIVAILVCLMAFNVLVR
jgi:hypothetical protein